MISHFILLAWFDGDGLAAVFNSPFIVPVFGTIMILGIVVAAIWSGVRTREMQSQERLAAIAKGWPPEQDWDNATAQPGIRGAGTREALGRKDGTTSRRAGLILVSAGVGLGAFFIALAMILQARAVLCGAATGLFPLAIGVGFLIDGRLRQREFERLTGAPALHSGSAGDLRPLH